ncbi:MAG: glycerophosphodiester phosphodiesterase [Solirubrobacteraceae bacterium]|jgi:glycerophosphoryl diester phosphodiesterase
MTDRVGHLPAVVAHRGAWGAGIRENSLAAFERAIDLGADMIEFDVRRTRDGQLIIFHDAEIAGRLVAGLTRSDLAAETGALPPLLDEVLELAAGRIALAVELKEDVVDQVAAPLAGFPSGGGQLIVISFIDRVLAQLTELTPQLRRGLLLEHSAQRAIQRARACGATVVLPKMRLTDEQLIAAISAAGLTLVVWSFLAAKHAALLSDPRVGGVITDDVPGALAARDASCLKLI